MGVVGIGESVELGTSVNVVAGKVVGLPAGSLSPPQLTDSIRAAVIRSSGMSLASITSEPLFRIITRQGDAVEQG